MSTPQPIGHITLRLPVFLEKESESWEIPKEYTYLRAGDAELVSHDLPTSMHEFARDELVENGLYFAAWDAQEMAAKSTPADKTEGS